MKNVARNIRNLRIMAGLSQEALARLLNVSKATVSNYETDTTDPSPEMLEKLAHIFNVTISRMFVREDETLPLPSSVFSGGTEVVKFAYVNSHGDVILKIEQVGVEGDILIGYHEYERNYFRVLLDDGSEYPYVFLEKTQQAENGQCVYACINKEPAALYQYVCENGSCFLERQDGSRCGGGSSEHVMILGVVRS